jgi:hypothetical protein
VIVSLDELEGYFRLLQSGAISEQEYEVAKRRLLADVTNPATDSGSPVLPNLGLPLSKIDVNNGFLVLGYLSIIAIVSLFLPWTTLGRRSWLNFFEVYSTATSTMTAVGIQAPYSVRILAIVGLAGIALFPWVGPPNVRLWGSFSSAFVAMPAIITIYIVPSRAAAGFWVFLYACITMQGTAAWVLARSSQRPRLFSAPRGPARWLEIGLFLAVVAVAFLSQGLLAELLANI